MEMIDDDSGLWVYMYDSGCILDGFFMAILFYSCLLMVIGDYG